MIDAGEEACFIADKKGYLPAHVACSRHCSPEKLRMLLAVYPQALFAKTIEGKTCYSLAKETATKSHPNYALIDELDTMLRSSGSQDGSTPSLDQQHERNRHSRVNQDSYATVTSGEAASEDLEANSKEENTAVQAVNPDVDAQESNHLSSNFRIPRRSREVASGRRAYKSSPYRQPHASLRPPTHQAYHPVVTPMHNGGIDYWKSGGHPSYYGTVPYQSQEPYSHDGKMGADLLLHFSCQGDPKQFRSPQSRHEGPTPFNSQARGSAATLGQTDVRQPDDHGHSTTALVDDESSTMTSNSAKNGHDADSFASTPSHKKLYMSASDRQVANTYGGMQYNSHHYRTHEGGFKRAEMYHHYLPPSQDPNPSWTMSPSSQYSYNHGSHHYHRTSEQAPPRYYPQVTPFHAIRSPFRSRYHSTAGTNTTISEVGNHEDEAGRSRSNPSGSMPDGEGEYARPTQTAVV
jgi:hypothetical protein